MKPIQLQRWKTTDKDFRLIRTKPSDDYLFQQKPLDSAEDLWQNIDSISEAALAVSFLIAECKERIREEHEYASLKGNLKFYMNENRNLENKLDDVRRMIDGY